MIRSILAGWVCIAWGLWLGSLGALFLFVIRLFSADYDLGAHAAPVLFVVFEKYQLILAALALIGAALLRIVLKSRQAILLLCMLSAAAILAALQPLALTGRLESLRQAGQTHTPEFQRLHSEASTVYTIETLIVLAAGFVIPTAIRPNQNSK
jgi:hypothetical protein